MACKSYDSLRESQRREKYSCWCKQIKHINEEHYRGELLGMEKKEEELYTLCSRLFSIRNPNQDAVIRAVAAATVARETWWQDAEGWRVEGVLCEDMGTMLRLICYHRRNTGRLVEIWHLKRNETDSGGGGRPAASRGADADGVWRISLRV